jgi:L-fuconolactonase
MFGGDWHVLELAGTYSDWVDIVDEISHGAGEHDRRKLFRDNAISFYRPSHRAKSEQNMWSGG